LLIFGAQSTGFRSANQSDANQSAATQFSVTHNQGVIDCVGNHGKHFVVKVTANADRELTPQDQALMSDNDYRPLHSSGCGYDTVAPVQQDSVAFRK
jgi:hypothetical protein